ncbi:MAG TPA: hypothetical protein VF235_09110 [Actinomycetota bacterium]
MLGERAASVVQVRPYDVHGVAHVEVAVRFDDDGRVEAARLGGESAPADLRVGEPILVRSVMATIVEIRRPG